ncbi:uncharacterized protein LOC143030229 [Oratosquilla oratoria]|uniref:uncharacterized protein LOC143030229 n=1 Tax=Oratosquilla oratoria TaxID=337810 RepID=UPI003F7617A0
MLRSSPALLGLAAIFVFTVLVVFIFDGFKSILVLNKKVDLDEEKARCIDEILGPHAVVVESEQLLRGPVTFDQDDPRLIQIIQKKFLHPPSTEPYNLKSPDNDDPSMGQSEEIRKILGEKHSMKHFTENTWKDIQHITEDKYLKMVYAACTVNSGQILMVYDPPSSPQGLFRHVFHKFCLTQSLYTNKP